MNQFPSVHGLSSDSLLHLLGGAGNASFYPIRQPEGTQANANSQLVSFLQQTSQPTASSGVPSMQLALSNLQNASAVNESFATAHEGIGGTQNAGSTSDQSELALLVQLLRDQSRRY